MAQQLSETEILKKAEAEIENERRDLGLDEPKILQPLTWEVASAGRFLKEEPPEREYTFENLLPSGCVGELTAKGGTGKSFLLNTLCISLATGINFFPFNPTKKYKTCYIGAEDPKEEIHRRIYGIAKDLNMFNYEDIANNLAIVSVMGKIEPIIAFDINGNPATTIYYEWIRKSLESLGNIEILILDPMSRFFGLRENENSDGTAWIRCLEKLVYDYNLKNLLFAHHISKSANQNKNLRDSSGRGAYSIRDGCRWTASMGEMTEDDGNRFEVNPRDYVELDISKANWSPSLPNSVYFKKSVDGILQPANLRKDRLRQLAEALVNELNDFPITRSDLQQNRKNGKDIVNTLSEFSGFKRTRDMGAIIDYALENGMLYEIDDPSKGRGAPRKILKVKNYSD